MVMVKHQLLILTLKLALTLELNLTLKLINLMVTATVTVTVTVTVSPTISFEATHRTALWVPMPRPCLRRNPEPKRSPAPYAQPEQL